MKVQFTGPSTQDIKDLALKDTFSMHVKQVVGSGATWTVILEGSLDGNYYTTILTHNDTDGDGQIITTGAQKFPCNIRRVTCVALSGGTIEVMVAAT